MKGRLCFTEKGNREKSEMFSRKRKTRVLGERERNQEQGRRAKRRI